ncbi:MAG: YdiU family protein [Gammaproteobacteria bacterium]
MSAPVNPIQHQTYIEMPEELYSETAPAGSDSPTLVELNLGLIQELGLNQDWFASQSGIAAMAGNGSDSVPTVALAYGGHQFGNWAGLLGDGRAHMLGQIKSASGQLIDVQLKGSGRTRFSRGGDGYATLGAVLREHMVSEAMAGLGIPTTRSLAVITTGQYVYREQPVSGAILVRTAQSHLRVGTFQYAFNTLSKDEFRALADFTIEQLYPHCEQQANKYEALLNVIVARQATLISQWMLTGFIHGVMNTDNTAISGETIDYGPCAFMDEFHPQKVFSSIDQFGRYAWNQQATIGLWNLTQLAHTFSSLLDPDADKATALIESIVSRFGPQFQQSFHMGLARKLGLAVEPEALAPIAQSTFELMTEGAIDFTQFFDRLTHVAGGEPDSFLLKLTDKTSALESWLTQWHDVRKSSGESLDVMRKANPAVIARNHRVEQAIKEAVEQDDFTLFRRLTGALAHPWAVDSNNLDLQEAPLPAERITRTYCGT